MKIMIDLENDSVDSLNKAMELINDKITEIDDLNKLNVEKYLLYFNEDEITYEELNEKIKDKEKIQTFIEMQEKRFNLLLASLENKINENSIAIARIKPLIPEEVDNNILSNIDLNKVTLKEV